MPTTYSKLKLGWHVSTAASDRDAIETVEQATDETERLNRPAAVGNRSSTTWRDEIRPKALVTDNGPRFKAARFAASTEKQPELTQICTRRNPNQNGARERAFGSLKHEHPYRHETDNGLDLGLEVETYRQRFNQIRPHESTDMRCPLDVHLEATNNHQTIKLSEPETLPHP
ncbi:MAG: integrase core domain-containing protein [Actinomycetia bacterium]|nr:integrase core domain-containing protein [Actinomycetes bacterium]